MSKCISGWHLIYTRPNQERKVEQQLLEREIAYLLPKTKVSRKWHDRIKVIEIPLFPSYVFVNIRSANDYIDCVQMDGYCYFVKSGNQLATVSRQTIDGIDLIVRKGKNVEVTPASFRRGEKIIIYQGSLSGLTGEIVEYKNKKKVCVRIQMLNRVIITDLESEMLLREPIKI